MSGISAHVLIKELIGNIYIWIPGYHYLTVVGKVRETMNKRQR